MPKRILPTSAQSRTAFSLELLANQEIRKLKKLNTPAKIQDFLNKLPFNFEKRSETYRSVVEALSHHEAHCFEGALIAAAALKFQGHEPLLMDLRTAKGDDDHVVALFKVRGLWGAISKTNHAVLRFREPVYASPRELAMSYFHEYFTQRGQKTMRKFSKPFDLNKFGEEWIYGKKELSKIVRALDRSPHTSVLPKTIKLRKADKIEIKAGGIVEYK